MAMTSKNNRAFLVFVYLAGAIIFFFLFKVIFENWQKIKDYQFSLNYYFLILAFLFSFLSVLCSSLIWKKILKSIDSEARLSWFSAFRIFALSALAKYTPGKIATGIGRIYLGKKQGIKTSSLGLSYVFDLTLTLIADLLFGLFFIIFFLKTLEFSPAYFVIFVILAAGLGLLLVHPKILRFFINLALKKIKKPSIPNENFLDYTVMLKIIFYCFLSFSLNGLAFFFLAASIIDVSGLSALTLAGGFILASAVSDIAFFMPGGLGVREGALVAVLKTTLGLPLAGLISILSRLWFILVDLILASIMFLTKKRV